MITKPNTAEIMSKLSMLGNQELTQYAALHKNDPFIFPLAFHESIERKKLRAQAAAQPQGPGGAPPPPVNEQALASMQQLPESSGIARIAPPGVATMAAGGIVGFAGGGTPEAAAMDGYRWEDLPPVPGDSEEMPSVRMLNSVKGAFSSEKRIDPKTGKAISFGEFMNRANGTKAPPNENYGNEGLRQPGPPGPQPAAAPAAPAAQPKPPAGLQALAGASGRTGSSSSITMRGAGMNTGPEGAPVAMPKRTATDFEAALKQGLDAQNPTVSPFAAQREEVNAAAEAAAKAQLTGRQGIAAEQGALYDKQAGRLDKREGDLSKEGQRNEAMSWITAGLEMLQAKGPGLAAIASGAQKGFGQYGAGLEKLKAAQERVDEARDRVDESRLGSKKEQLAAQGEYDKALMAGKKDALADTMAHYNVSRQVATEMLKMKTNEAQAFAQMTSSEAIAEAQRRSAEKIAAGHDAVSMRNTDVTAAAHKAAANASGNKQIELYRAFSPTGDIREGYKYMQDVLAGKFSIEQAYAKYRDGYKPLMPGDRPQTLAEFSADFGPPKLLQSAAGASGKVLDAK